MNYIECESAWAPGWDPVYPSGRPSTAPGTVFVPDVQAGTISVRCRPDGNGTVARVVYRLTALDPAAEPELRAFADGFDDMMAAWERHIG
jgi:hypothetical protein